MNTFCHKEALLVPEGIRWFARRRAEKEKAGLVDPASRLSVLQPKVLHHQSQCFEFVLQHRKCASSHFDTASRIKSCLRRHPVTAAHQENLQQFCCFARVDHAALQQIVPQRRQFHHREAFFHGRHHLRPFLPD